MLLAAWYACNLVYSVANKAALRLWPFPFTFGAIQLGAGILYVLALWSPWPTYDAAAKRWRTRPLRVRPTLPAGALRQMLPAAALLAIGHTAATAAPAYGSVAFTNVVKTTETLFASLCLAVFARQTFAPAVYATLVPVVGGVALATVHELEFSWFTLGACGVSMNAFALYSIAAKQLMARPPFQQLGARNLFASLCILSFALLVPTALAIEGAPILAWWRENRESDGAAATAAATGGFGLVALLALTGFVNYLSNELAFCVLELCSPLTYAVANTLKRVIVIVGSVLAFHTPVTPAGALGATLAISGAFLYSFTLDRTQGSASKAAATAGPRYR